MIVFFYVVIMLVFMLFVLTHVIIMLVLLLIFMSSLNPIKKHILEHLFEIPCDSKLLEK